MRFVILLTVRTHLVDHFLMFMGILVLWYPSIDTRCPYRILHYNWLRYVHFSPDKVNIPNINIVFIALDQVLGYRLF